MATLGAAMPKLGDKVRDRITGFEGTVTGRVEYLTGCAQVLVQPSAKKGDWVEARWFDETRVDVTGQIAKSVLGALSGAVTRALGPDQEAPKR